MEPPRVEATAPRRDPPGRGAVPRAVSRGVFPSARTEWGGLFYLVHRVLELDLAEHLYCAMVREREMLACAARLLLDAGDDPAPALFGGVDEVPDAPAVHDGAFEEVFDLAVASLRRALLFRTSQAPDDLGDRLLREAAVLGGSDDPASRLVGLVAVAPAHLFLARLGLSTADPRAIRPYLRLPARVLLPPDELVAVMPMSAIDVNLRIAALDMDPGWAPWLGRTVSLVFEAGDEDLVH